MYFPNTWRAKEPQNHQNHRVAWENHFTGAKRGEFLFATWVFSQDQPASTANESLRDGELTPWNGPEDFLMVFSSIWGSSGKSNWSRYPSIWLPPGRWFSCRMPRLVPSGLWKWMDMDGYQGSPFGGWGMRINPPHNNGKGVFTWPIFGRTSRPPKATLSLVGF